MKTFVICKDENSLKKISINAISGIEFVVLGRKFYAGSSTLFIIETDFDDSAYSLLVEQFMKEHSNSVFWAGSFFCNKENIVKAYSVGFKNFVQFPITKGIFSHMSKTRIAKKTKVCSETFENMVVTIVDDNEINIELLKEVLSVFKIEMVCFTNPFSALHFLNSNKSDLILLDVMMPELNGFELAEKIKHSEINSETPIIFVSALSGNINKTKGYKSGSFVYIEKPFEIETIRIQLANLLKIGKLQRQREDFIATLTHDLRTPIKAQIRALELLTNGKFGRLTDEQKEIISEVLVSCRFLQFMTDDVLIKYKYDNGKMQIKQEPCSLKKITEEIIASFRYILEQKNQTLKYYHKADVDVFEFDKIEIARVINNLIMNATEYTKENGIITVTVSNSGVNEITFSVKNEGIVTNNNPTENVFGRYYSESKKYDKIGVGLGLYISKKIVELHNGKINVKNENNFTEFSFTLPLKNSGLKPANSI